MSEAEYDYAQAIPVRSHEINTALAQLVASGNDVYAIVPATYVTQQTADGAHIQVVAEVLIFARKKRSSIVTASRIAH